MHRGYEIVVLFAILVIVERLTSCCEDIFSCEFTRSLEDTGSLEEVHGISEVAVSEFGDEFEWVFLCPSFWFLSSRGTKRSSHIIKFFFGAWIASSSRVTRQGIEKSIEFACASRNPVYFFHFFETDILASVHLKRRFCDNFSIDRNEPIFYKCLGFISSKTKFFRDEEIETHTRFRYFLKLFRILLLQVSPFLH